MEAVSKGAHEAGGTVIGVTPIPDGRWAAPSLSIFSMLPNCVGLGCFVIEDYSIIHGDKDIKWLSNSLFGEYDADRDGHAAYDFCDPYVCLPSSTKTGIDAYNELEIFYTQSMTYQRLVSEGPLTNKKGYANVFCTGEMGVWENGVLKAGQEVRDPDDMMEVSVGLIGEGPHRIMTSMSNLDCFASVVKHPLDLTNQWFRIFFFGYEAPTFSTANSPEVVVTVEDRQPSLEVVYPIEMGTSGVNPDVHLLAVTVRNNGDVPVRVTDVENIGGTSARRFVGRWDCELFAFPPSMCPGGGSGGFGVSIPVDGTETLYVVYTGDLEGDVVRFIYEPLATVCNVNDEFGLVVNMGTTVPVRCEIEPFSVTLTPYEIHEFNVACYNAVDTAVDCVGNNWYWADVSGVFTDRTSSYALAYVTGPPSGRPFYTLIYQTGSVTCQARLFSAPNEPESPSDPNSFVCELVPESAELEINNSQYFDLVCTLEGVPVEPLAADYSLEDGLDGSLSGGSTDGVTFTATVDSEGNIQVIATYRTPADPSLRSAIDWAHVIVGVPENETINETTNETGDFGDTKGEGCVIIPNDIERPRYSSGTVSVLCEGEGGKWDECSGTASWNFELGIANGDARGAVYTISDPTATYGRLHVNFGGDSDIFCWADVKVVETECIEYT